MTARRYAVENGTKTGVRPLPPSKCRHCGRAGSLQPAPLGMATVRHAERLAMAPSRTAKPSVGSARRHLAHSGGTSPSGFRQVARRGEHRAGSDRRAHLCAAQQRGGRGRVGGLPPCRTGLPRARSPRRRMRRAAPAQRPRSAHTRASSASAWFIAKFRRRASPARRPYARGLRARYAGAPARSGQNVQTPYILI